jgi:hypothetical protein
MHPVARRSPVDDMADARPLRRILTNIGLVLAVVLLVALAIYAAAFIMLAPMMQ